MENRLFQSILVILQMKLERSITWMNHCMQIVLLFTWCKVIELLSYKINELSHDFVSACLQVIFLILSKLLSQNFVLDSFIF